MEGDQPRIVERVVEVDGMELHLDPEPDPEGSGGVHTALPPRLESWRRRSATGAILTGFGMGLKEVFEPRRDEPSIVVVTSGDPLGDRPVEAQLGGILPANNVVKIRPWLLTAAGEPTKAAGDATATLSSGPAGGGPSGPIRAESALSELPPEDAP